MKVTVNGKTLDLGTPTTIGELLGRYGLKKDLVVAEVNGKVLDRDEYGKVPVAQGDRIELISFMGGG